MAAIDILRANGILPSITNNKRKRGEPKSRLSTVSSGSSNTSDDSDSSDSTSDSDDESEDEGSSSSDDSDVDIQKQMKEILALQVRPHTFTILTAINPT